MPGAHLPIPTFDTYWLDSLPVTADEPALCTDVDCDLLVVGGGFCGLWAAILAKQQRPERDVLLIEARSVANGASGRPAAILSTSVMHGIDNTKRMFPDEIATLEALGRQNMDDIAAFFDHYSIDCDIEWNGEMKGLHRRCRRRCHRPRIRTAESIWP